MTGAKGFSRVSLSSSTAIPGTGRRAFSSRTKEFHAARKGRGSAVTMIVSSTSQMMPISAAGSTIHTAAVTAGLSPLWRVTVCHPGLKVTGSTWSITPPRSVWTTKLEPLTLTVTGAPAKGVARKLRHPRIFLRRPVFVVRGLSRTTRERTLIHVVEPYPVYGMTWGVWPRRTDQAARAD